MIYASDKYHAVMPFVASRRLLTLAGIKTRQHITKARTLLLITSNDEEIVVTSATTTTSTDISGAGASEGTEGVTTTATTTTSSSSEGLSEGAGAIPKAPLIPM